jgi:hypothetical protein
MATTTAYVTPMTSHPDVTTRRHAGHNADSATPESALPTPGWPSLTLGPAGVATRTGHHAADSALTIPERLAAPAGSELAGC